ncbi:MAG TPA: nucleoside triphosphate pyrophosphohydrolase [Synergistales bacterium]|jgi:XTP/dITP diphosphohydrolase/tetrapyrrole methylase family protein/MazG family protein/ATP diphosphatase|nr:nucleoside triphosphate pyrophosphohydrolase [Synergistales bacterium]HRV70678.1 nucleoside triphosphate pyrophosphohydrolase [Thermovirgaceae bacterium]
MNDHEKVSLRIKELLVIMEKLRSPGGCPWDREQTMHSLRPCILEEAYELVEAIERDDDPSVSEECGDLLLQVVFISCLAAEENRFGLAEVIEGLNSKLVRRHPHVFGEQKIDTSDAVLRNWERIKQKERKARNNDTSVFAGVPRNLPALARARRIQERAAKKGFDWLPEETEPVISKIREEIEELSGAVASGNGDSIEEEMGDLLFAMVNLSRRLGYEAEFSLQRANRKFMDRFRFIEESVESSDRNWSDYSLEELEDLWQKAKKNLNLDSSVDATHCRR